MTRNDVGLDDKYTAREGTVFLTGLQALVRLPMAQRRRDLAAGLNTAGYVSGYRGSPIGRYDMELWRAEAFLKDHHIHFQPGVNEDLAATAAWGTQQVNLLPGAKYDGVFSMWYGKAPGVDRSGDAFKHAMMAGTSEHGGVIAMAADDHMASSSAVAHGSEYAFVDAMMPVLNPSGIDDFIPFGLYGIALSRFSGAWVGFKVVADTIESSGTVDLACETMPIAVPEAETLPDGGLNIRLMDQIPVGEQRLFDKVEAAKAFARVNPLNRVVLDSPRPKLGIAATGKAYLDLREALRLLGIDNRRAADLGLRIYKIGMIWPLEPDGAIRFADGLDEILVIEEKRPLVENQFKELLYNRSGPKPRVTGKSDETGRALLPPHGGFSPEMLARILAVRIGIVADAPDITAQAARFVPAEQPAGRPDPATNRMPHYCPGCPHNTSTRVPDGSTAIAGVGCHTMAAWLNPDTKTYTQMGGEGVTWVGRAPFTDMPHVFQNLGDGTYFHSGLMGIRAAIAAKVNITYKLLYNDAVAMTGGQPTDGTLTVPDLTRQIESEGVTRIAVVSDDPDKYPVGARFASGVTFHHRDDLDAVQRELREIPGVSVLVYDQTCAAEKRRRRKRGKMDDPARYVFINEAVCEGCGDCGVASNCLAVVPVETPFGRKRAIDQYVCNKDYSCLKGFCPALVTVEGGAVRRPELKDVAGNDDLPLPPPVTEDAPYSILVAGVGGTGVVTIGALLGMAAHLDGKASTILDMTGLSQKGGAVYTHIRLAGRREQLHSPRIAAQDADLLLACDLLAGAAPMALEKLRAGRSVAVVNDHKTLTGAFVNDPNCDFASAGVRSRIITAAGEADNVHSLDAVRIAARLVGDSMASNVFLLGYAFQLGKVPVSADAIERAIRLNGVAVDLNLNAFRLGRRAVQDPQHIDEQLSAESPSRPPATLAEMTEFLTGYQDAAYAARLPALMDTVSKAEQDKAPGRSGLADAVARAYFKLLTYKDEYEVARLHADPAFKDRLARQFSGDYTVRYHLAPPFLNRSGSDGLPRKRDYGPWMETLFSALAKMKGLRRGPLDPFGRTEERRAERQLITEYERLVGDLLSGLTHDNHALAVEIAELPLAIRGFGHVKDKAVAGYRQRLDELAVQYRAPSAKADAAE